MKIVSSSTAVFACHSKACAPPPAGTGGSDSATHARYSINVRPGTEWNDREFGRVKVKGIVWHQDKDYDTVTVTSTRTGQDHPIKIGKPSGPMSYITRLATIKTKVHNSDDGVDRAKDNFLTGKTVTPPWRGFGRGTVYGDPGKKP